MNLQSSRSHTLSADLFYPHLKEFIIESTGLAYYQDKDIELAEKIDKRLRARNVPSCSAYLSILQDDGTGELDELVADLTIGETYFFRHEEQFEALRQLIIPALIRKNAARRQLRIWSAGCATGAETYSLSILLRREFGQALAGWDVTILGTDINRKFLARAREGHFGDWTLRSTPEEMKQSCFVRAGNGWCIHKQYQEGISFQYHNLVKNPYPSLLHNLTGFDLILCRNVMIYFSQEVIRACIARFWNTLVEEGWLVVGHAEAHVDFFRSFRTINFPGTLLFERRGRMVEEPPQAEAPSTPWQPPFLPDLPPLFQHHADDFVDRSPSPGFPLQEESETARIRELADRADWITAAALCQQLIDKDKLNPLGHFYYALILEQMAELDKAEISLNRAIYLNRDFVLAHYHRGLLLQKNRETLEAIRSFRNALNLLSGMNPDHRFSEADHISAADLSELARMQLEILEEA